MKHLLTNFCKISAFLTAVGLSCGAIADPAANPRSAVQSNVASPRVEGRTVQRGGDVAQKAVSTSRSAVRRSGTTVARGATSVGARSAVRQNMGRADSGNVRAATSNVARSAMPVPVSKARVSAGKVSDSGLSRAATTARATAVFTDISKIGGGYAACREAYATCMDQFCANANDTYRRCYCSAKFTEFRDTEAALDEAKTLLMQFEDNNLFAVDKTAEEVNAMYTATVGEAAIKKDTSGAQSILNEIGDLLSGKKKASSGQNATTSLGIMSLDFSGDIGDIWSGGDASSIFDTSTGVDLTSLEGQDLFNAANKQCLQLVSEQCDSSAVLNMSTSAYGIMITQDCNAYEKKVNAQREAVKQTVRQAEKYLREARLEEYRSHNSADVNECISKVKAALTTDVACGANYKRCLDYSGAYINQTTGEPIYSPRLFELENLISLGGAEAELDLLGQNAKFNKFLDDKRMFAKTALDSCRDISDIVWTEFKRTALIEIAQAQDEKIEEVKTSCVSTMAECYDTQTNALKNFDTTTAQAAGAISAYAAKAMCQDKVTACAALYGNNTECAFDGNGKLTSSASACGLTALLAFVDTVDEVRVAEGCASAIDNYVKELCTPTTGEMGYPWNCRKLQLRGATGSFEDLVKTFAVSNCSDPTSDDKSYEKLPLQTRTQVEKSVMDVEEQLEYLLMDVCEDLDGYWLDAGDTSGTDLAAFYTSVYGSGNSSADGAAAGAATWGRCVQNDTMVRCLSYNKDSEAEGEKGQMFATYDRVKDECILSEEWYAQQCTLLGNGYFENGVCYVTGTDE